MGRRLYVGNLAFQVTDADLNELFSQAGTCDSATVITDKFSGQSRGFGFVEMSDSAAADQAIAQMNGKESGGRALVVNEAKPREAGGGGRGGFGGGGGGGRGGFGGGGGGGKRW